jgi:hypothetical protein
VIPNPLHPTYRTRINIRPIKSALIIGERSVAQFREAALDSCTTWGGITNLIVPVGPSLDVSELDAHLLHLHEPDVVIGYLPVDTPTGRARHDRLRLKLQGLLGKRVAVHAAKWGGSEIGCHPLNAIPEDLLAARQFLATKFVASSTREELTLLALFGQIYPGQEADYVRMTRFGEQPVGVDDLRFRSRC